MSQDYVEHAEWMYRVRLYIGDQEVECYGAPNEEAYKRLLIRLVKEYTETEKDRLSVSIYDGQRDCWVHPAGKAMPDDWDGMLLAWNQVKVGSWNG